MIIYEPYLSDDEINLPGHLIVFWLSLQSTNNPIYYHVVWLLGFTDCLLDFHKLSLFFFDRWHSDIDFSAEFHHGTLHIIKIIPIDIHFIVEFFSFAFETLNIYQYFKRYYSFLVSGRPGQIHSYSSKYIYNYVVGK